MTLYYSISGCGLDTSSSWTPSTVFEANNCYYFYLTVASGQATLQLYRSTSCTKPFSVTAQGFERKRRGRVGRRNALGCRDQP